MFFWLHVPTPISAFDKLASCTFPKKYIWYVGYTYTYPNNCHYFFGYRYLPQSKPSTYGVGDLCCVDLWQTPGTSDGQNPPSVSSNWHSSLLYVITKWKYSFQYCMVKTVYCLHKTKDWVCCDLKIYIFKLYINSYIYRNIFNILNSNWLR